MVGTIHTVRPAEDFWQLARRKRRFPSRKARFCTELLKVKPSHGQIVAHLEAGRRACPERSRRVIKATGVRHDESHSHNDRGDVPEIAYDAVDWEKGAEKRTYVYSVWYPIRTWSLEEVWAIHRRYLEQSAVIALVEEDPELEPAAGKQQRIFAPTDFCSNGFMRQRIHAPTDSCSNGFMRQRMSLIF